VSEHETLTEYDIELSCLQRIWRRSLLINPVCNKVQISPEIFDFRMRQVRDDIFDSQGVKFENVSHDCIRRGIVTVGGNPHHRGRVRECKQYIVGSRVFDFAHALRDFMHLEANAHDDTVILIHDVMPIDEATSVREEITGNWTGDVWRLAVILREVRPDLTFTMLDVAPSGLGVVRGLSSTSTVLSDRYDELVTEYMAREYSWLAPRYNEVLRPVPTTSQSILEAIGRA